MGECGCLIKFAGHKTLEGHYANVILIAVRSKCHQSRTASIYRTRPKNKIRNLQKWLNSLQSIRTPPDINVDSNLNNFKPVHLEEKRQVMIWHFSLAPYECFCEYSPIIRLPSVGMHRSFLLQVFPLLGGAVSFIGVFLYMPSACTDVLNASMASRVWSIWGTCQPLVLEIAQFKGHQLWLHTKKIKYWQRLPRRIIQGGREGEKS